MTPGRTTTSVPQLAICTHPSSMPILSIRLLTPILVIRSRNIIVIRHNNDVLIVRHPHHTQRRRSHRLRTDDEIDQTRLATLRQLLNGGLNLVEVGDDLAGAVEALSYDFVFALFGEGDGWSDFGFAFVEEILTWSIDVSRYIWLSPI